MHRAWVLSLLVACAGSSPPPQSAASVGGGQGAVASSGVTCDQAVGHMMDMLTADKSDVPPADVKRFHDLFVQHCQADTWSVDVRQCFGAMKTLNDGDACGAKMTDPQRQALDNATKPPAAAPTPATPASTTRSPTIKSGDPCEGGN
jgi:hypothetical protein